VITNRVNSIPAPAPAEVFDRVGILLSTSLEYLVSGYYRQAAALAAATGDGSTADVALALYLSKADPLLVLRDLLGHSSVLTTEAYLRRLDTTRIFADAYEACQAGPGAGTAGGADAEREAAAEFAGEDDGGVA